MKKIISILLAAVMISGVFMPAAYAGESLSAVVSLEGLTIGQGFYSEPEKYTLQRINGILGSEHTEDDITARTVLDAFIKDKGLTVKDLNGTAIKDIDKGTVAIHPVIGANGGPSDEDNKGQNDEYLGSGDYSEDSRFILTVNNSPVSDPDNFFLKKEDSLHKNGSTHVLRWQFSLTGDGRDLGYGTEEHPAFFKGADKDKLFIRYANSNDGSIKSSVLPVMENLTAGKAQVNAAANTFGPEDNRDETPDITEAYNNCLKNLAQTVPADEEGCDWTVFALSRSGYYKTGSIYFENFYKAAETKVSRTASGNGVLSSKYSTENSRLITVLASIGKDASSVSGFDLYEPLLDTEWVISQGINGPAYALLAFDSQGHQIKKEIKQKYIDNILASQLSDGGWSYTGDASDADLTAICLCALHPYRGNEDVSAAADKAFSYLSSSQNEDGSFSSFGEQSSESASQVITALSVWGFNADTDSRFIKNGTSVLSSLLSFYLDKDNAFPHKKGGDKDLRATEQAVCAITSYMRFLNQENSIYDMSDIRIKKENFEASAILSVPAGIENKKDASFNIIISVDNWDNAAGIKMIDFIMPVPANTEVTSVKAGGRLKGGDISYNTDNGKLRAVYFDAARNSCLSISGTHFPAELFIVSFRLKDRTDSEKIGISLSGMSFKRSADSSDEDSSVLVDTSKASGFIVPTDDIMITGSILYKGDGIDLIPADKTAVTVSVIGRDGKNALTLKNGDEEYTFYLSPEITAKTGIPSYIGLIPSSTGQEVLSDSENYIFDEEKESETIIFGDCSGDGIINAQDALDTVNTWLRKNPEPTDREILQMNINADGRINTFDALGISENFVYGTEFQVIDKAAERN